MMRRAAVGALVVAATVLVVTVAAAPAYSQILPPVTTPPIDIGVPGLDIEVHVPGQELGGSSLPGVPDVPGLPPTSGSIPSTGSGGGSDGNFTGAMGIPTLDGLGVRGGNAHTLEEYIEVESLAERGRLMAGLLAILE